MIGVRSLQGKWQEGLCKGQCNALASLLLKIENGILTKLSLHIRHRKFPPPYQAGFLVARRDPDIMTEVLDVIKEGNYTEGWGYGFGWGGSGHGGYVGAMAMQGVMAYFYDHVKPDNAVELNLCRHNHMGMDVLYRAHPNYTPRYVQKKYIGGCRNTKEYCEGETCFYVLNYL